MVADEKHLAYARVDESPVAEAERFEIGAAGARVFKQRYSAAGQPNARVTLAILALDTGAVAWCDLGAKDYYLARVAWLRTNPRPRGDAHGFEDSNFTSQMSPDVVVRVK